MERKDDPRDSVPAVDEIPTDVPPVGTGDPSIDMDGIDGISIEEQSFEMQDDESGAMDLGLAEEDVNEADMQMEGEDESDMQQDMYEEQQQEQQEEQQQEQQKEQDQSTSQDEEQKETNNNENQDELTG